MDEDRKIRFLIAPMLFLASIVWAVVCDPRAKLSTLLPGTSISIGDWGHALGLLAGGGVVAVAVGVIVGVMSHVALRIGFLLWGWIRGGSTTHEISLDSSALSAMWAKVKAAGTPRARDELYVGVTFDYDVLQQSHPGVHGWLVRRWNAFSISVTSIAALLLSLVALCWLPTVALSIGWSVPVSIACVSFLVASILAWRDTMGMLSFQARRVASSGDEG